MVYKAEDEKPISVIMAAYNAEQTISQAIDSVLAQSMPHFELIVVDDRSADKTGEILDRYEDPRIRILHNAENRGAAASRYLGAEAAAGDWIAILDSDDLWRPDKLERQIRTQRESGADLVYTGSAFITAGGKPIEGLLHVPERIRYQQLLRQNVISNSSVLVRKELYLRYSPRADALHEDYACWLGMLRDGYLAVGIDSPLLVYRLSKSSKTGNKLRSAKMNWRTLRYSGLPAWKAAVCMGYYAVNGIRKYAGLKYRQDNGM